MSGRTEQAWAVSYLATLQGHVAATYGRMCRFADRSSPDVAAPRPVLIGSFGSVRQPWSEEGDLAHDTMGREATAQAQQKVQGAGGPLAQDDEVQNCITGADLEAQAGLLSGPRATKLALRVTACASCR